MWSQSSEAHQQLASAVLSFPNPCWKCCEDNFFGWPRGVGDFPTHHCDSVSPADAGMVGYFLTAHHCKTREAKVFWTDLRGRGSGGPTKWVGCTRMSTILQPQKGFQRLFVSIQKSTTGKATLRFVVFTGYCVCCTPKDLRFTLKLLQWLFLCVPNSVNLLKHFFKTKKTRWNKCQNWRYCRL